MRIQYPFHVARLRRIAAVTLLAVLASTASVRSSAQSVMAKSAPQYAYALPAGWSRGPSGDAEVLLAPDAGAGAAQLMLLVPKPAGPDFTAQFASERAALESYWALRSPLAAPLQQGRASLGPYGAWFASYDSDAGPRYLAFLAQVQRDRFAMLVFVAATPEAYARHAAEAVELFKALAVAR